MKYHLITMGCPKNKVDSDGIEMLLRDADYRVTDVSRDADVLIVNTCGFLEAAKEESIDVLQELGRRKRKNQILIAAGCLAQRNGAEVLQRVPKVDGLLGTRRWMDVVELIQRVRGGKEHRRFQQYDLLGEGGGVPSLLDDPAVSFDRATPRPPVPAGSAYLKISDGCNAPCAFCTIPSFKGKLRSRPLDAIVDEAQALVDVGARELVIVAQDTTDYGRDWGAPDSLSQLLSAICNRTDDRLRWIRLMYAYPGHVSARSDRSDGPRAQDPTLSGHAAPARRPAHLTPDAASQPTGDGLRPCGEAACRDARHCPAHDLHRGLSGRN